MANNNRRAIAGLFIALLIIMFCFTPQFRNVYNLPEQLRIVEGESTLFTTGFPLVITVSDDSNQFLRLQSSLPVYKLFRPVAIESLMAGHSTVNFKLFGFIPLRTIQVDVLPPVKIMPGGQSIGVVLHSQGVIVVGNSPVQNTEERSITPAKDAGINVGDIILSINGVPVQSDVQVAELINDSGKNNTPVNLLIKRNDTQFTATMTPVLCSDTNRYRIGLFVRDSAAGVGTLTFFEPQTHTYGALGHVITDGDTNQPIVCEQGKIVQATVSGIQHGRRGQPGEKIGVFINEDHLLGNIKKNTTFGIYGQLNDNPASELYSDTIPVAYMNQVQTGYAEILTVVDGEKIERFGIEIQKINLQSVPESKGLVIKVTDPRLLEMTGGIVQGMSGSPIIQNGKLVGAVTHVFVHDPTRGYGCFVDWMLMESGIIPAREPGQVKNLFTTTGGRPVICHIQC